MGSVVVVGGGIIGLATAMMLAKDGLEVTVLDQDGGAVPGSPEEAWSSWARHGIAQFHQPHMMMPGGYRVLRERLPEMVESLEEAGASRFNVISLLPAQIEDRAPRPDDDKFDTFAARRPVLDYAFATCAGRSVDVRRGVEVTGLIGESLTEAGVPRVTGVRTAAGEEIRADLVIDASGRRTHLPAWLTALSARPPQEEVEDAKTAYYTRYFHSTDGTIPKLPDGGFGQLFDSYTFITVPADQGHWSVTVIVSSADQELKELRHVGKWMDLMRACPDHVHLLDGEAEDKIRIVGGNGDRLHRFVMDGTPVATGVLAVGDSLATMNPTLGRGLSLGLIQAAGTADAVRDHLSDPYKLALEHDNMIKERVLPWYGETVQAGQAREAQIQGVISGHPQQPPALGADPVYKLITASFYDADLFRAWAEDMMVLTPLADILARPGLIAHATTTAARHEMSFSKGPSRPQLLKILAD